MSEAYMESTGGLPRPEPMEFLMTSDQLLYIQSKLPKCFSLQQSKKMQRREKKQSVTKLPEPEVGHSVIKVKKSAVKESSLKDLDDPYANQGKRNRPKKVDRFLEPQPQRPKSKHTLPSQKMSDEDFNKCFGYLQQLKRNPNAWPFLEPVNPIKLGIPDYFDVIKEPMDLSTVEKNLKSYLYSTMNQFHVDINRIWLNSYHYNQKGSDIYKLTTEMDKFYARITTKGAEEVGSIPLANVAYQPAAYKKQVKQKDKSAPPKPIKPKLNNQTQQMTISEKRELCQDIKKLPKQHLSGIWKIVATGRDGSNNIDLDVDKLERQKLWKLYNYVKEVNSKGTIKKPEEKKQPNDERPEYGQQEAPSAQSSFILDSDSDNN